MNAEAGGGGLSVGPIAIFGLVLGIFLAFIGLGIVQDLQLTLEGQGGGCTPNPIPIVNWWDPEICQEADVRGEISISGVGVVVLYSMLILIFMFIFIAFMVMVVVPALRGGIMFLAFFGIFLCVAYLLSHWLGLFILELFA